MDNLDISVKKLNDNITRLFDLFSVASKDVNKDNSLSVLNNKLDKVMDQHEQIADAIIALKEMLEEKKKTPLKPVISQPKPIMSQPTMPKPMMSQPMPPPMMRPSESPPPIQGIKPMGKERMPPPPLNPLGKPPRRL